MPELIGPSEETLSAEITLDFEDAGNGTYTAKIYVCTEGTTLETFKDLTVLVTFILIN